MTPQSKLDYFITRTDERLAKMDAKLDELTNFKMKIVGMSAVIVAAFEVARLFFGK